jgi:cell division protein FtsL
MINIDVLFPRSRAGKRVSAKRASSYKAAVLRLPRINTHVKVAIYIFIFAVLCFMYLFETAKATQYSYQIASLNSARSKLVAKLENDESKLAKLEAPGLISQEAESEGMQRPDTYQVIKATPIYWAEFPSLQSSSKVTSNVPFWIRIFLLVPKLGW